MQTGATPPRKERAGNTEHGRSATSLGRLSVHIRLPVRTLPTSKTFRSNFQGGVGGEVYVLHSLEVMKAHASLGAKCFPAPSALNADSVLQYLLQVEVSFPCPPTPRQWSLCGAIRPCRALPPPWPCTPQGRHVAQGPWRSPVSGDVKGQRCQETDAAIQS